MFGVKAGAAFSNRLFRHCGGQQQQQQQHAKEMRWRDATVVGCPKLSKTVESFDC
jgi:hypothetical protein